MNSSRFVAEIDRFVSDVSDSDPSLDIAVMRLRTE